MSVKCPKRYHKKLEKYGLVWVKYYLKLRDLVRYCIKRIQANLKISSVTITNHWL